MRTPIIDGNWKMNKTMAETKALLTELKPLVANADCEVIVCVPYTNLQVAKKCVKGSNIKIASQNIHWAESGAFTGEISALMLKELKVDYALIGHSERRQYFGETNETVNKRAQAALAARIKPIICVGETEAERQANMTEKVLEKQLIEGLAGFKSKDFDKIVIAYEPVWAIGTGKTATPLDANDTIGFIRHVLNKKFRGVGDKVRILYGGSMNAKNCKDLMAQEEIDGGLVGGASLKSADFSAIVNYNK